MAYNTLMHTALKLNFEHRCHDDTEMIPEMPVFISDEVIENRMNIEAIFFE